MANNLNTILSSEDEAEFLKQFKQRNRNVEETDPQARKLSDDPDSPFQFFDARKEFLQLREQGKRLGDQTGHGSSIGLKKPGHPTQFGFDTPDQSTLINRVTGLPATQADIEEANQARTAVGLGPSPIPVSPKEKFFPDSAGE